MVARALDNNMYVVAANMGTYYLFAEENTSIDTFGGRPLIGNYRAQIAGKQDHAAGSIYVGGVIDVEALRDHRARAQLDNWLKDLRTELIGIQLALSAHQPPRELRGLGKDPENLCISPAPRSPPAAAYLSGAGRGSSFCAYSKLTRPRPLPLPKTAPCP